MAKLGISIKIDVTKILKERLFQGAKGTYVDLTTFIDTNNVDQYDNNGFISQSVSKDERDQGVKTPILGNCKVFFNDSQQAPQQQQQQQPQQQHQQPQQHYDMSSPNESQSFQQPTSHQQLIQQQQQMQQPVQNPPGYNAGTQGVQQAPQNASPQPIDDFDDDIPF